MCCNIGELESINDSDTVTGPAYVLSELEEDRIVKEIIGAIENQPSLESAEVPNVTIIEAVQKRGALRVASSYRTVSEPAVLVVLGVIPIDLLAVERKYIYDKKAEIGLERHPKEPSNLQFRSGKSGGAQKAEEDRKRG